MTNAGKIKETKKIWYKKNLGKVLSNYQKNYVARIEAERKRYALYPENKKKIERERGMPLNLNINGK